MVRASCDSTVSLSLGLIWSWVARNVMPENMLIAVTAIIASVARALSASGGLNAGTPSDMASTPVSAVQPWVNARNIRKSDTACAP